MSKTNFARIGQFTRGVHQPLPKTETPPATEWITNGPFIGYPNNGIDSIAGVEMVVQPLFEFKNPGYSGSSHPWDGYANRMLRIMVDNMIQKYPRPPVGLSRFWEKNSIPRGISDKHPFGDPTIQYRGIPMFHGMVVRPMEREFLETWIKHIASMK